MFNFLEIWTDIDQEGCIEPDNDEPQEMGDSSIEVGLLFTWWNYEMWRWINQHDTSVGQRKILSPRRESSPWPPEHRSGALSTELQELMESKVI